MIRLCLIALVLVCVLTIPAAAQCPGGTCSPGGYGGFAAPIPSYGYYQERSYGYSAPAWQGGPYSAPAWQGGCPCQQGMYRYSAPSYSAPLVIPRVEELRTPYAPVPPLRERLIVRRVPIRWRYR